MKYVESVIWEELRKLKEQDADILQRGKVVDNEYYKAIESLEKEHLVIATRMGELHNVLKLIAVPAEENEESVDGVDQPNRRRYTDDEILQLVSLKESGKTYTEIGRILGRTRGSLSGKLHEFKYGKQVRKVIKRVSRKKVTPHEKQEIRACYLKGLGVTEAAKHLNRGVRTVSRIYAQLRRSI